MCECERDKKCLHHLMRQAGVGPWSSTDDYQRIIEAHNAQRPSDSTGDVR